MKLLYFRRILQLERNIYHFNLGISPFFMAEDPQLLNNQELKENTYYEAGDMWLRIICLPARHFKNVLSVAVLLLLNNDRSLLISGKKLAYIRKFISYKQLQMVMYVPLPDWGYHELDCKEVLTIPDFWQKSFYQILSAVYREKHPAMGLRLNYRFQPQERERDLNLTNYWQNFSVENLEYAITRSFELCLPNTFNLVV